MKNRLKIFLAFSLAFAFGLCLLKCAEENPAEPGPKLTEWIKNDYTRELKKVGLKPEQLFIYSIGQSHIDAAWLWRWRQTRDDKCPKTFRNALENGKLFPGFSFHQSSPQYYQWIKETRPGLFQQIQQAEKDGAWVLVGGMWVEPDCNLPEGESLVRQQLYGQRFFLQNFGHISEVAWIPDSFGFNWNLPQFLARAGQKYLWTYKVALNDYNLFPFHLFFWQGPDGSRIQTYICPTPGARNYFKFSEFRNPRRKNYLLAPVGDLSKRVGRGFRDTRLLLKPGEELIAGYLTPPKKIGNKLSQDLIPVTGTFYGAGDGGNGPKEFEIKRQLALQELGFGKLAAAPRLFAAFEKYSGRLPTWNDELYLDFHQGVMTTQEWIKRANRKAEADLRTAEAASSLAFLFGGPYPAAELVQAWKLALFNQFHDILPGTSIPEVFQDARADYLEIQRLTDSAIKSSLNGLADKIESRSPVPGLAPILVFNPLGWERKDPVKLAVAPGEYQIFNSMGAELAGQVSESPEGGTYLYFLPEALPALGWKIFFIKRGQAGRLRGPRVSESADAIALENDLVKIAVSKKNGLLISLYDKILDRELISKPSNRILAFKDRPEEYSAWNLAADYAAHPIPVPESCLVKIDGQGPVFARLLVERTAGPTRFKHWITVSAGSPMVEFLTWTDLGWKETLVKVEFNTVIETDKVAAEIPYAVIERSTHPRTAWDQARSEMPIGKWADLSNQDFGVALLNFGKHGLSLTGDGKGFRMSIIKNAKYHTAAWEAREVNPLEKIIGFPQTDAGEHWAHLALYPHPGGWQEGKVYKAAYQYNTPAVAISAQAHSGALPAEASLFSLVSDSAYIAQVKKAEDDDSIVIRIVEGEGKDTGATLQVNPAFKIVAAAETDLLELNPKPLNAGQNSVILSVGHFEIKTIKLSLSAK